MTFEECRQTLTESSTVQNIASGFRVSEDDRRQLIDVLTIRCSIDHDPTTYRWSDEQKKRAVVYRYCSAKAEESLGKLVNPGVTNGSDEFAQGFRQTFQRSCETTSLQNLR
jgi:hypothetical protein